MKKQHPVDRRIVPYFQADPRLVQYAFNFRVSEKSIYLRRHIDGSGPDAEELAGVLPDAKRSLRAVLALPEVESMRVTRFGFRIKIADVAPCRYTTAHAEMLQCLVKSLPASSQVLTTTSEEFAKGELLPVAAPLSLSWQQAMQREHRLVWYQPSVNEVIFYTTIQLACASFLYEQYWPNVPHREITKEGAELLRRLSSHVQGFECYKLGRFSIAIRLGAVYWHRDQVLKMALSLMRSIYPKPAGVFSWQFVKPGSEQSENPADHAKEPVVENHPCVVVVSCQHPALSKLHFSIRLLKNPSYLSELSLYQAPDEPGELSEPAWFFVKRLFAVLPGLERIDIAAHSALVFMSLAYHWDHDFVLQRILSAAYEIFDDPDSVELVIT